jgi:hypothetical protein
MDDENAAYLLSILNNPSNTPQGDYYPIYAPPSPDAPAYEIAQGGYGPPVGGANSSYATGEGLPGEEAAAGGQGGAGGTGNILPSSLSGLLKTLALKPDGSLDLTKLAALAAGGAGLSSLLGAQPNVIGPRGYTGTIPTRTMVRERVPYAVDPTRRPGSSARQYFTPAQYVAPTEVAAAREAARAEARGIAGLAAGGMPAAQGRYLGGPTDGMADKLPANIDGKQEARLSHGEFVIPADVVSHLGNGNSEAGAQRLYDMMDRIRTARTGTSKQGKQISPDKYMPK